MTKKLLAPPAPKPAVIYARVSSKEQAEEGYSIDSQLALLREYCYSRGLAVSGEFIEAETAKTTGRREFHRMVEFIKTTGVGAIVFEKVDRAYRNLKDPILVDELGIERHFVKENMVLSSTSRSHEKFVHDIKLVVAKNYIDNLSEEAKKGMLEKAKQGVYPSMAPIGYLNVQDGPRRGIAIDPERGPLVYALFERYAAGGLSFQAAAKLAASMGLRTRKDCKIPKCSVSVLLQNPMYMGVVVWNGSSFAGTHEPIVSKELFDKVQDVINGRSSGGRAGYGTKEFSYKGIFTCGHCGCGITAEIKKGQYVYYHCTGRRGACPGQKAVREESITEQLSSVLQGLRIAPEIEDWLRLALKESFAEEQGSRDASLKRLVDEQGRLRKKLGQLYADKIAGVVPESIYPELKKQWERELAEAEIMIRSFDVANRSYYEEGVALLELARNAHLRFKEADPEDKRELLRHLGSNFKIVEGRVALELRNSFKIMFEANSQATGIDRDTSENGIWWAQLDSN